MDIVKVRQELMYGKTIYDMKLRVGDYGRVSTEKDDQLNSLENQSKHYKDYFSSVPNWTHVNSYYDEGISGTQVYKRDNFLRMIEDARLGKIDLIVTKEVSRFARNTIDSIKYTQELLKYGVIVLFESDNINTIYPDSEFRLTLMASMAQDEVRKLSERVKFGVKRSIKDGKLGGGNLCGYIKKDGKLTINEKEVPIVETLFNLYSTGEYGFKRIGEILADNGYYTKKGKIYSDITLKKMLRNPRYKGYYTANISEVEDYKTHKKKYKPREEWIVYKDTKGNVPAIISEELWEKANKIYDERNAHWNKTVLNKEFYLENRNYTSKLFCKEHNTTFIRTANGKYKDNPVWRCNEYLRHGIKGCESPIIYESHLNDLFESVLNNFIDKKEELVMTIVNDYKHLIKESNASLDMDSIKEKIQEQETFKERLIDMSLRNIISEEDFKLKNDKLNVEINKLKDKLIKLQSSINDISYYEDILNKIKKQVSSKIDVKNNIGKIFDLFVDKVFISKVDNNRKHIKLEMIFNFKRDNQLFELNWSDNNSSGGNSFSKLNLDATKIVENKTNRKYMTKLSFDNDFLRDKYLLLTSKEPRFC